MHTRIWSAYPHSYIINQDINKFKYHTHDKRVPVTMTWPVVRLWMEEWPRIWGVAVDILNNELWTADKGWSSSLGFGQGANNSSPYTMAMLRKIHNCLRLGLILWCNLSNGKRTIFLEVLKNLYPILSWTYYQLIPFYLTISNNCVMSFSLT